MLYSDVGANGFETNHLNIETAYLRRNFYDAFLKTIERQQQQMPPSSSNENQQTEHLSSSSKQKRAYHMARVRAENSEYRRIERERNARAMAKKRFENPLYREEERRRNRHHMAKLRRENQFYREQEKIRNSASMAQKRTETSTSTTSTNHQKEENNAKQLPYHYQILETNLNSSHISFIPYKNSNVNMTTIQLGEKPLSSHRAIEMAKFRSLNPEYREEERIRNAAHMQMKRSLDPLYGNRKRQRRANNTEQQEHDECQLLKHIDVYCRNDNNNNNHTSSWIQNTASITN